MTELIFTKNRTGPTGKILLRFDKDYGNFYDWDPEARTLGNISLDDLSDNDFPFN